MSTKDIIKELCAKNKISVNKLETDLGFGTGYVSKLDKSTPNTAKIQKIADYFGVSIDFLLTGVENSFIVESAKENAKLISLSSRIKEYALKLAELPKEKQDQIISLIDMLEDIKEE